MEYAIFNGQIIPLKEALLPITHKGYFFDFAVYDIIKVVQGKLFFAEYHVERLLESAKLLDITHSFTSKDTLQSLQILVEKNHLKDALIRLVLIGDTDGGESRLYIFPVSGLTFYPDSYYSKGVKVITYKGERRVPQAKSKDLLLGFLGLREAKKQGAIDALLVDREGNIREGVRSNFFAIKGATIITPPREHVLEGITKKIVLEAVKGEFEIKKAQIPLKKIQNYDELFITSTSKNIMPIRQIDETIFKPPFNKTREIQKLFKNYSYEIVSI